MGYHAGWEHTTDLFWEFPLGTMGTSGFRWISDQPDSLNINAEGHARQVIGNRFLKDSHLRILKTAPGGALGATPFWFTPFDVNPVALNRLLNSHFQNQAQACGIPPAPCYTRHFPTSQQTGTLGGFTVSRDIGLGASKAYVYTSGVMEKMVVEWKVGQPMTMVPEFRFLTGLPNSSVRGAVAASDTSYQRFYFQAPAIDIEWNGTPVQPAGFKITSSNSFNARYAPTSKSPVGFVLGRFNAELEMDVWIEDNFYSRYVPVDNIGTGVTPTDTTGTFQCTVSGPVGTMGGGGALTQFNTIFYFTGKIINVPGANQNMGNPPTQKVKMMMTATGTAYNTSGYYIEVQAEEHNWQTPDGL